MVTKAATDRKAGRGTEVELDIFGTKHTAYLLVFSLLGPSGYRYAESDATRSIRDQIAHPDRDLVPSLLCDFSPYPMPQDAIAIQDSAQPHCWIVKMGAIGVILPRGGSYEHFKEVIDLPDQIRSLKRLWRPAPFGRTPSIELSLRPDSGLHTMDLFRTRTHNPGAAA